MSGKAECIYPGWVRVKVLYLYHHYNNRDMTQYLALMQDILDNGASKTDRTGTGTLSVFGRQLRPRVPNMYQSSEEWNAPASSPNRARVK